MHAWSTEGEDIMGPTVTRTGSGKANTPPLKNGSDLRSSGYLIAVGSRTARFRRKHKNKMLLITLLLLILILLCLAIVMTVLYVKQKRHKPIKICESKECLRSAANLALSIDKSADPCDNFYQYACGNWAEDHPRPDAYSSYDWFRHKQTKVYAVVRDFLNKNISGFPKPVRQAKDVYTACMDTDTLDKLGLKPAFDFLESVNLPPYPTYVNATKDFDYETYTFDWLETVIKVKTLMGMDILIGFGLFTDPKNSTVYRLVMGSPEASNPFPSMHKEHKKHDRRNKRYFTKGDIELEETFYAKNYERRRSKKGDDPEVKNSQIYKVYYAELMKLFIVETGKLQAADLSDPELDKNILTASEEYYDMYGDFSELEYDNGTSQENETYMLIPEYTVYELQNHTDAIVEANSGTPSPIWKRYLEGIFSISTVELDFENDKVLVSEQDLKYMSQMAAYLANTPPAKIELYIWIKVVEILAWHTTSAARELSERAAAETRGWRPASRGVLCAGAVNDMMGMAVTYAVADPHFLNVTKPQVETMLNELKNAFAHLVGKAKWMDDYTKLATYQKIIQMKTLIGFPDWFLDDNKLEEYYSGFEVKPDTHVQNILSIIQVKLKKSFDHFREGNNYTWASDPTEVNAYHTFQENTISNSLNFGSLGTVLGHEMTHGFDNFGRQFDKDGNYLPWWSNETIEAFVNITQCFVDQYSAFIVPEINEHVDGKRTLGENIADNGGLREALAALRRRLRMRTEPKLPGFEHLTPDQLFFLSYANLWCGVETTDSLRQELDDEHSPQRFRTNGALQNSEEFAKAWHCPSGSTMNPRRRCIIY